jgi:hypothetical protein
MHPALTEYWATSGFWVGPTLALRNGVWELDPPQLAKKIHAAPAMKTFAARTLDREIVRGLRRAANDEVKSTT